METPDDTDLKLANLYITADSSNAPTQQQARTSSYLRLLRVRKSRVWMENVTLEGVDDVLVEGVDFLGSSSTPGRIFAKGTLRHLRGVAMHPLLLPPPSQSQPVPSPFYFLSQWCQFASKGAACSYSAPKLRSTAGFVHHLSTLSGHHSCCLVGRGRITRSRLVKALAVGQQVLPLCRMCVSGADKRQRSRVFTANKAKPR